MRKTPKQSQETSRHDDRLWDSATTAQFLGVPVGTLDAWASRGGGPAFSKIGKHRRYRPRDVEKFVDASRVYGHGPAA